MRKLIHVFGLMATLLVGTLSVSQAADSCCKPGADCCKPDAPCCPKP